MAVRNHCKSWDIYSGNDSRARKIQRSGSSKKVEKLYVVFELFHILHYFRRILLVSFAHRRSLALELNYDENLTRASRSNTGTSIPDEKSSTTRKRVMHVDWNRGDSREEDSVVVSSKNSTASSFD